jgi:[acyl-carrier-protein] S-malonyltransferase
MVSGISGEIFVMVKAAFIFPGQGSQYVGMGKDLFEHNERARALFEQADAILGCSLGKICFEGPDEILQQTNNTQPAIFLHSMVIFDLIKESRSMMMTAGHSLGEYSALVAAGALSFEDGLRLVRTRGELMQQAGLAQSGTMAAIIGLGSTIIKEVCAEASAAGVVQPANFNSPGQVVISGSATAVRKAMELAKTRGARLVKELPVSGAFHSPLMESACDGLRSALEKTEIRDALAPVYANVTAKPVREAKEIRELLFRQLTHPVRWEETVVNMASDGATTFVECGPGKVLQGLVKRILGAVEICGIEKLSDLSVKIVG